jgi:16S rRNA processing protein RimM
MLLLLKKLQLKRLQKKLQLKKLKVNPFIQYSRKADSDFESAFLLNWGLYHIFLFFNFVFLIYSMTIEESFYIGYVSKTRGLKGEVQLFFEFEDYDELELDVIFLEVNKKLVPYFVDAIKLQKNSTAYATFEDVEHIDKAQAIVRRKMYLPNDKMPERDPDDFRWKDLVGFLVIDEEHGELGEIVDVTEMPQQFIATVELEEGKQLMFPLSEDLILGIDGDEEIIEVDLPEGLVDLYKE